MPVIEVTLVEGRSPKQLRTKSVSLLIWACSASSIPWSQVSGRRSWAGNVMTLAAIWSEAPRDWWRVSSHGRVVLCLHRGSIRTSCVSVLCGW
jgi:hypothetical protein